MWGRLGFIRETELVSAAMYADYGLTSVNVRVGFLSSLVDNMSVMFAVLSMDPDATSWQGLLAKLTADIRISMSSRCPKAGVALMAQAPDSVILGAVGMVLCNLAGLDCKYSAPLLIQRQADLGPKRVTDCTPT